MITTLQVSGILVDCFSYYFANGKMPRGGDRWAFTFGGDLEAHTYEGSFAQAKKQAARDAKRAGFYRIKIAS